MRIAFWLLQDSIQQWNQWIAGLYYIKHCLEALASLPSHEVPEIYAFVPESLESKLLESEVLRDVPWLNMVPLSADYFQDYASLQRLEAFVASYRCDILFPAITPPIVPVSAKVIGWITDFQHKHYPQFFSNAELTYRDHLFWFLTGICDRIVCSSETVEQDLHQFFPPAAAQSFVLKFSVAPPRSVLQTDVSTALKQSEIDTPFVYLPYQFWIHKNHQVVFEAWRILKSRGRLYTLVCSGASNDSRAPGYFQSLQKFLRKHQLENQVKILGLIDRDRQWQLYRASKMVIQPSLFEGWSTSVEEARNLGKPILLSDIPVHREQMQSEGRYFDPSDAVAIADLVDATWQATPPGHDPRAEQAVAEACQRRVTTFGRRLIELFEETQRTHQRPIASMVLPLYLQMYHEANARLKVIDDLSLKIRELQRGIKK